MKNKFASFIIIISILFSFILPVLMENAYLFEDINLNPNDYARITEIDYKAIVVDEAYSEGKVVITERLTFDVHAASAHNLFWELWRDLPEDYIDGVKVHYKVNSVKQILEDGTIIEYEESPKLYWDDFDYVSANPIYGPGKWYHSEGPYDEEDAQYECVFFYVDGLYREKVVFEIEYEMYNAALKYNDCSDLYLAMYSGSTTKYLESFNAEILFPNEDMPSSGNYDVYTYGTDANDFPVTGSSKKHRGYYTFSMSLDEEELTFSPYNEYLEFDLVSHGRDRHIFTEYAPDNYYSYDDVLDEIYEEQQEYANAPAKYKSIKIYTFIIFGILSVLVLLYAFTLKQRMRKKHVFFKPALDIKYFREIPSALDPYFAASLVFCRHKPQKDDSGIYSSILLSLARKEYVELKEMIAGDFKIIIKKTASVLPLQTASTDILTEASANIIAEPPVKVYEPLTTCEEYYFNLLVRHAINNEILMSTFQHRISSDYENTNSFLRNMRNSIVNIGVKDGYFQKADYQQPKKKIVSKAKLLRNLGIFFLVIVNFISCQTRMDLVFGAYFIFGISCIIGYVYLKQQASQYVLLTQLGEDEYAKWRGLYNFLNSETLIHERTVIELPLWEQYLVYATAFGLSEKVIKAISIRCPKADDSPVLNNNCYRSRSFHHSGRSFHSAVHTGSHGGYSGGGGGFGYGGGGRGGGGGGGGH